MTFLSLFTFMHWRRKWQPTPVFLPGESQGWGSLVGCCLSMGLHRVGHNLRDLAAAAAYSHASKIMLKILQARLQQYMNEKFQMYKLDLEKADEPEIKLPKTVGSWKKQEFQKNIYFCFTDYSKVCVPQQTAENSQRDGITRSPYLPPVKPVSRSRSNS